MASYFDRNDKRPKVAKYEMLDIDAGNKPPPIRKKLVPFLRRQRHMPGSFMIGITICLGVILYARWLSWKILRCPDQAIGCRISPFVQWNAANIAIVQGMVTIFYCIGLTAMGLSAQGLAESMIWPLLGEKHMSIAQIETYLATTHGTVPMRKTTIQLLTRTALSALVMILAVAIALIPLVAGPIVGTVFARADVEKVLESKYTVGAGIGRIFAQTTPPISVGAESLSSFISWGKGLSREPLPDVRQWIVDRSSLLNIGNITVNAMFTKVDISCRGFNLTLVEPVKDEIAIFSTNMASHNPDGRRWNSSSTVQVHTVHSLSVWVDDFTFEHRNRSSAVVIFSAPNGTIEGGTTSYINTDLEQDYPISTLACTVTVEFIDSILQIGKGGPSSNARFRSTSVPQALTTLSSVNGTHISFRNSTRNATLNTLNENALWFAVAPVLLSPSVGGAQPSYYKELNNGSWLGLPVPFTKGPYVTADSLESNNWTLPEIHHFINVSIGAVAQASSRNFQAKTPVLVRSLTYTRKLVPMRVWYLVAPMAGIIVGEAVLMWLVVLVHQRVGMSVLRMASVGELLRACQTEYFFGSKRDGIVGGRMGDRSEDREMGVAKRDDSIYGDGGGEVMTPVDEGLDLNRARVMFGWTRSADGGVVAGLSPEVKRFV